MQRTPNTPTKIASTPTKTASTPNIDSRCFVARQFFIAKRTFLAYNLHTKKCGGVQQMTNIRYDFMSVICFKRVTNNRVFRGPRQSQLGTCLDRLLGTYFDRLGLPSNLSIYLSIYLSKHQKGRFKETCP